MFNACSKVPPGIRNIICVEYKEYFLQSQQKPHFT